MTLFYKTCALVAVSKGLAIASPWFLKGVVDTMALTPVADLCFSSLATGITMFGVTRLVSTVSQEYRMIMLSDFIQRGLRRISHDAFTHLHSLDLNFHKTSSKNTVFAINRAIRSIESGLRFSLGFASPIAVEFVLLCTMLGVYVGPSYLAMTLTTLGLYTYYSWSFAEYRRV